MFKFLHGTTDPSYITKYINYNCNFFTKIIMYCRCMNSPQGCFSRILLNKPIGGTLQDDWEANENEARHSAFKGIKFTSGAYYSVTRGWLKLHLSEQFLSEPISTHLSWADEQKWCIWEKCMNNNKKKINYIIATSAAEEIDLDAAIASVVVKEPYLKRRRL